MLFMPCAHYVCRDSHLIRTGIWCTSPTFGSFIGLPSTAYPPDAIIGPTLFSIPAEELFFFVIQTYIVCTEMPLVTAADWMLDDLAADIVQ